MLKTGHKAAILSLAVLLILSSLSGCALFSGKKSAEPADTAEAAVFDRERTEQEKLSDFAASAGRTNPHEKKQADKGQTFLLSNTAKDIYNNLER